MFLYHNITKWKLKLLKEKEKKLFSIWIQVSEIITLPVMNPLKRYLCKTIKKVNIFILGVLYSRSEDRLQALQLIILRI